MNRLSLEYVKWGDFEIGKLFNIRSSKSEIDRNKLNQALGNTPYITRSDICNGVNTFVTTNQNSQYKIDKGNCITIGLDTQTVFYQQNEFFTGQNIQVLRHENLTKENALFIIPLLKVQMKKFSWGGTGATLGRLNKTRLMLPIDFNGNPSWQFMEDYAKQEMKSQAKKIVDYYEKKLIDESNILLDLDEIKWKLFQIDEIFDVKRVEGKSINNYDEGSTPYVTTSSENNGITNFVNSIASDISKRNAISVDPVGGTTFYHDYDFVGRGFSGSSINLLYNDNLNNHNSKFVCSAIEKVSKVKASYGIHFNGNRLKNAKILLPSEENGNPNWEYMTDFIKNLERETASKVLDYIYIYIS